MMRGLDRGEYRFLRYGVGLTRRELRRLIRAESYNWHELRRELVWAMRPAKRILELNAGGILSRCLLREVLRRDQVLFGLGQPPLSPLAALHPGRFVPLEGDLHRLPADESYDLIVSHSALGGLDLAPDETVPGVLALLADRLSPGGRLLLVEKTIDGVAQKCGELLLEQLHAELARLRGRVVHGLHRLDGHIALVTAAGLAVTSRVLIGRDPGPRRNRVLAAALHSQRQRLIGLCPPDRQIEAEKMIDEARGKIARAPEAALPLALLVAEKPLEKETV